MLNSVFLQGFTIALIVANIFCFMKKKYLYLIFPCLLFLPQYYGLEGPPNAPLLTASRIMLLIFFIYAIRNRKKSIKPSISKFKELPKEYYFLAGYFFLRILTNLYYAPKYHQSIKTILLIIFEQLFLLLAVYLLSPKKEELIKLMKIIVWAATVLFVIGIIESIFSVKPFDALYTVTRDLYVLDYYRLGLLRATTTMYAPAIFGNMCLLVMPFILFLFELTKSKKYLFVAGLDVLAIIHSGSRAAIIFLFAILFLYMFMVLKTKARRVSFIKHASVIVVGLVIFIIVASISSDKLNYYYLGTVKSVLNEVGFSFDIDKDAPSASKGLGGNPYGSASRTRQFTGMYQVAKDNPLFGLGSAAATRGEVKYYWKINENDSVWITPNTYDVGIVEIFCDEGLIGLLGMCSLFIFMIKKSRKNNYLYLLIICYLLSTLNTGNMFAFLMLYVIYCTYFNNN